MAEYHDNTPTTDRQSLAALFWQGMRHGVFQTGTTLVAKVAPVAVVLAVALIVFGPDGVAMVLEKVLGWL